ncbi:hypothetical protein pipiens_019789, partial [Culex pipiens pipiens]
MAGPANPTEQMRGPKNMVTTRLTKFVVAEWRWTGGRNGREDGRFLTATQGGEG